MRAGALGLVLFVLFIAVWHLAPVGGLAPTPGGVWRRGVEILSDPFYRDGPGSVGVFWHLMTSLQRVIIGFVLAALIAIPLGFLLGRLQILRWAVDPLVQILRPVSPLAWLPIGLALLHDAERTAVFVIATAPVADPLNTIDGPHIHPLPQTHPHLDTRCVAVTQVWSPRRCPASSRTAPVCRPLAGHHRRQMLVGGQGIGFFVWNIWNLDIDASSSPSCHRPDRPHPRPPRRRPAEDRPP